MPTAVDTARSVSLYFFERLAGLRQLKQIADQEIRFDTATR